ncbi:GNAT family N-acetyltransferase [Kineococcus sp. SYSU DK006]|uniref:GNAT family N-acetyltransferase n=1 Tax=Kineococcus sp. SYSU DK006 TaxID=3383127 RepID=UPI003D7D3CDE
MGEQQAVPSATPGRTRTPPRAPRRFVGVGGVDEELLGPTSIDRSPCARKTSSDLDGEGLGSRLAAFTLEDAARAGVTVVALCPSISAHVQRHPEHRPTTTAVRPEHLATLPHRRPS